MISVTTQNHASDKRLGLIWYVIERAKVTLTVGRPRCLAVQ
jgi:hypothetical protein